MLLAAVVRPGACLETVMKEAQGDKNQCVVLIAGANNVYNRQASTLLPNLKTLVTPLRPCQILVGSIPFRRDLSLFHKINEEIMRVNLLSTHDLSQSTKSIDFLDIWTM